MERSDVARTNRCTVTPGDSSPTLVNRRRGPPPTTRPTHGFYAAGAIAVAVSQCLIWIGILLSLAKPLQLS
jgi:hypothetical protein